MLLASLRKKKGDFYGNRPGEIFSEILLGATNQVLLLLPAGCPGGGKTWLSLLVKRNCSRARQVCVPKKDWEIEAGVLAFPGSRSFLLAPINSPGFS